MAVAGAKQVFCLTKPEQRQLESFINHGRKHFRLLYSARRDTCSSVAFHRHCDYKGPTVTVVYNTKDTVYGGYTSMNWTQDEGVYVSDPSAFLFQLKKDGVASPKVFRCTTPANAIYCNQDQAAVFGKKTIVKRVWGHDLDLMTGTVTPVNGVYTLNGSMTFKTYDMEGVDKDGFCNNSWDVLEIQVYCITDNTEVELASADLLTEPWRCTVDWGNQLETSHELKGHLERYIPLQEDLEGTNSRFPNTNILIMGPVGAGKSSFLNTVNSTFRGKIFNVARSGCAEKSLTTKFGRYTIRSSTSKGPMNFKLCDSRGLQDDNLMTRENMRFLLEGHLVDRLEFEPCTTINQNSPGFKKNPRLDEKIHCVAIFIDATSIDSMTDVMPDVMRNIKDMQTVMNSLDIPQVIIMTKVDNVCEKSKQDASAVYRSRIIEQCVSKVSEMFGLPRNNVFPMKNYEQEGCLNTPVNILTMYTLRMILDQADAYLYNQSDEIVKDYKSSTPRQFRVDD